jgi:hypothetical protein
LVVHEWGTFTSLQDESGSAIGGINTDDEPVPKFVHRLSDFLLLGPTELPPILFQGAPHCHPDVTMRLETPVIYFHPSKTSSMGASINVRVKFRGGWLSEFYPNADADTPGLKSGAFQFGRLQSSTISSLGWESLQIGGGSSGPPTTSHVWTAPRAVQAAALRAKNGESEKFLFYRGVGHVNAPLKISSELGELTFRSQLQDGIAAGGSMPIRLLWLVDIRPDGKAAFRILAPLTLDYDADKILAKTAGDFEPGDYRSSNVEGLRKSLQDALVGEGLFSDEAQALLNTWELSYFKSAGLRVFFIVPCAWTDFYLPLEISAPAQIKRVMVGRIELVTPAQRVVLREICQFSSNNMAKDAVQLRDQVISAYNREWEKLSAGQESLATAGISVPGVYRLYLSLGRFKNTLVLDEATRRPTEGLKSFISSYGLEGYQPSELSEIPAQK